MRKFEIKIDKKFEVEANSREDALKNLIHDFSLEELDKKYFSVLEISEDKEISEDDRAYGYYIWHDGHLAGNNGEIAFNTEDEARKDAKEYVRKGLMEEYNEKSENNFRIEIISYSKNCPL